MDWWKKNKWKVLAPVLVIAVLAAAFWYGGDAPGLQGWPADGGPSDTSHEDTQDESKTPGDTAAQDKAQPDSDKEPDAGKPAEDGAEPDTGKQPAESPQSKDDTQPENSQQPEDGKQPDNPAQTGGNSGTSGNQGLESRPGGLEGGMSAQEKVDAAQTLAGAPSTVPAGDEDYSESQGMVIDPNTGKDKYLTDPVPEGKPLPVEPQDVEISDKAHTCTLSISCAAILDNMGWLDPEKAELVPEDGWILKPTQVTFYEGESVFNVLQRTCKQQKIHMEFTDTPMYNSAYIEGIHNLYEFDCGELSGWMYKVNEWFPNYGCSRYALKDGDVICWEYTCDLGVDIGGFNAIGG